MAPHNFKEFDLVLREVERLINCDPGHVALTVRSFKRKDGELRIHGPQNCLGRITVSEFFIVEVVVSTPDISQ